MRAALQQDLAGLASRHWPDVTGDLRLLRFLRGFDHSIPQALEAVRDMLATRARYGMDELHEAWAYVPCHHISGGFPHQAKVNLLKPGLPTVGFSLDGHPIAYEPLRLHNYAKILDAIGEEGQLDFYLCQCESRMQQVHALSEQAGCMIKLILVIDLKSVNFWQLTSRRWARYDAAHNRRIDRTLAELLARVYVINMPAWAVAFYRSIRWWVPKNTLNKIRLLTSAETEGELLQVMSRDVMNSMLESFAPDGTLRHKEPSPSPLGTPAVLAEGS